MSLAPFEQVVDDHGARVLRLCRGMVGPDEADDAWSETFLKALRAWPDLPDDLDPEAWLVTVARRTCLDVLRARGRRALPTDELPERATGPTGPTETAGTSESPETIVTSESGVWAHVAALPRKQREVVTYRYLGGLGYGHIVELVGGTEAAARRAAADGLKTLRQKEIR